MKLSVSLPATDVDFLDAYAKEQGFESRSAALQRAVRMLRTAELAAEYEAAFTEWDDSEEAAAWDSTAADGLSD